MLVGIWLGLHWVLFYFFDHYIQSSVQFSSVQFSSVQSSVQFTFIISSHLSGSIYAFWFDIPVMATSRHDTRGYLVWTLLGIIFLSSIIIFKVHVVMVLSSFFDHSIQSSVRIFKVQFTVGYSKFTAGCTLLGIYWVFSSCKYITSNIPSI